MGYACVGSALLWNFNDLFRRIVDMPDPVYSHLDPELGPPEVDPRSIHAFWHGFPSPLVRWHFHHEFELHLIVASEGKVFVGDHVGEFAPGHLVLIGPCLPHNWISQTQSEDIVEMRDWGYTVSRKSGALPGRSCP